MKKLLLFVGIFISLYVSSCNEEETTAPDQFPRWLQTKITELTSEFNLCKYTDVAIYEYNGKQYYHVYCGVWSCDYCQLFDTKGNRPEWNTYEWNDFRANKKAIKTLPACP